MWFMIKNIISLKLITLKEKLVSIGDGKLVQFW